MANLPDLDLDEIGIIAFWNAFDYPATGETVDDIDPTDVLSEASIATYEQYDNGVQGTITCDYAHRISSRDIHFRVKDDGWFIVWVDRTNSFGADNGYGNTFIDIVNDWTEYGSNISPANHFLERKINALADDLSNFGIIDYNAGDVGIYCYEYKNAVTITQMSEEGPPSDADGGVSYTSGITRHYHAVGGVRGAWEQAIGFTSSNNIVSATESGEPSDITGVRDVISLGLMPESGTYYFNDGSGGGYGNSVIVHLMLWS